MSLRTTAGSHGRRRCSISTLSMDLTTGLTLPGCWLLYVPTACWCISVTNRLTHSGAFSHPDKETANPTCHLTQSQYTDTGPTSPSRDPVTPGARQGSHWSTNVSDTSMSLPGITVNGWDGRGVEGRGGRGSSNPQFSRRTLEPFLTVNGKSGL